MNVFYTDHNPVIAARNLDDRRMNKMLSECIQMLSIAIEYRYKGDVRQDFTFGKVPADLTATGAHRNHPSTIWVRSHPKHYLWTVAHCRAMISMRQNAGRSNANAYKLDNCEKVFPLLEFPNFPERYPPFASDIMEADPDKDIVENYRDLMNLKWRRDPLAKRPHTPTWEHGLKPSWCFDYEMS